MKKELNKETQHLDEWEVESRRGIDRDRDCSARVVPTYFNSHLFLPSQGRRYFGTDMDENIVC